MAGVLLFPGGTWATWQRTRGNVRDADERRARAAQPGSNSSVAFTVILNHLRSLDSIDDPSSGPFVRLKRKLQAEYLADLIQSRQAADPNEKIAVAASIVR